MDQSIEAFLIEATMMQSGRKQFFGHGQSIISIKRFSKQAVPLKLYLQFYLANWLHFLFIKFCIVV